VRAQVSVRQRSRSTTREEEKSDGAARAGHVKNHSAVVVVLEGSDVRHVEHGVRERGNVIT
jgi:hypothetical protein